MQFTSRIGTVLAGRENNAIRTGTQSNCGNPPSVEVVLVVCEKPPVKIHGVRRIIAQLYPIGSRAVFIDNPAVFIGGQEFIDDDGSLFPPVISQHGKIGTVDIRVFIQIATLISGAWKEPALGQQLQIRRADGAVGVDVAKVEPRASIERRRRGCEGPDVADYCISFVNVLIDAPVIGGVVVERNRAMLSLGLHGTTCGDLTAIGKGRLRAPKIYDVPGYGGIRYRLARIGRVLDTTCVPSQGHIRIHGFPAIRIRCRSLARDTHAPASSRKADFAEADTVASDGGMNAESVGIAVMVVGDGHLYVAAGLAGQIKALGGVLFACQDGLHRDSGLQPAEDRRAVGLGIETQLDRSGVVSDPVVSAAVVLVLPEDNGTHVDIAATGQIPCDHWGRATHEIVRRRGVSDPGLEDAGIHVRGGQSGFERIARVHCRRHSGIVGELGCGCVAVWIRVRLADNRRYDDRVLSRPENGSVRERITARQCTKNDKPLTHCTLALSLLADKASGPPNADRNSPDGFGLSLTPDRGMTTPGNAFIPAPDKRTALVLQPCSG